MTQADLTSFEAVGDKLFLKEGTKIENLITESTSDRDESKAALFNLVVDELLLPPPEASAEELHGKSKTPPKMCIFCLGECTYVLFAPSKSKINMSTNIKRPIMRLIFIFLFFHF